MAQNEDKKKKMRDERERLMREKAEIERDRDGVLGDVNNITMDQAALGKANSEAL
jgi:hypothetical protein